MAARKRKNTYIVEGGALGKRSSIFRCWGWHCNGGAGEEAKREKRELHFEM